MDRERSPRFVRNQTARTRSVNKWLQEDRLGWHCSRGIPSSTSITFFIYREECQEQTRVTDVNTLSGVLSLTLRESHLPGPVRVFDNHAFFADDCLDVSSGGTGLEPRRPLCCNGHRHAQEPVRAMRFRVSRA